MAKVQGALKIAVLLLVRYGPLAFLAGTLLRATLLPVFRGEVARPEVPPDGFVSHDTSVYLGWARGDLEGPVEVEVAADTGFRRIVHKQTSRGSSLTTPPLERGRTYYWRLQKNGVVAFFRTARDAVDF